MPFDSPTLTRREKCLRLAHTVFDSPSIAMYAANAVCGTAIERVQITSLLVSRSPWVSLRPVTVAEGDRTTYRWILDRCEDADFRWRVETCPKCRFCSGEAGLWCAVNAGDDVVNCPHFEKD